MLTLANINTKAAIVASTPANKPYFYGYVLLIGILAVQAIFTVFHSSVALHDSQQLAQLQQQKNQLQTAQVNYQRQAALNSAIKPIQQELSEQYQPITTFLTASQHKSVASR